MTTINVLVFQEKSLSPFVFVLVVLIDFVEILDPSVVVVHGLE